MRTESRTRGVQCISPAGLHRISYLEWGEARNPRVVVCAHGLTRCARDFDNLARARLDDRIEQAGLLQRGELGFKIRRAIEKAFHVLASD